MIIHWSLFVPGVLLLLYPADRLLSARVELRSFDCFQSLEHNRRYRPWWWVPLLWIDPFRGFLGTVLLKHACAMSATPWAAAPRWAYVLLMAIFALGVLCQTFTRRGDRDVMLAPIGFVCGLVVALVPWPVSLIGIVTAALGLFAFRQFHAFFAFGLVAICLLGLVLDAEMMWIGPGIGVFALPVVVGLITNSTLELPARNSSGPLVPLRPFA